jgi:hypothetical protein
VLASTFALPLEGDPTVVVSLDTGDSDEAAADDYDDADHYHIGFFSRLNSFINAFRNRMWNVRTELMSGFDIDDLPPEYSNSTFHEEVVNGTRVQVNQTIFKKEIGDSHVYIFRKVVKVVDPESESSTGATEETTTVVTDRRPTEETEGDLTPSTTQATDVFTPEFSNDLP